MTRALFSLVAALGIAACGSGGATSTTARLTGADVDTGCSFTITEPPGVQTYVAVFSQPDHTCKQIKDHLMSIPILRADGSTAVIYDVNCTTDEVCITGYNLNQTMRTWPVACSHITATLLKIVILDEGKNIGAHYCYTNGW